MSIKKNLYLLLILISAYCNAQNKDWTKLSQEQEEYRLIEPNKSIQIGEDIIAHCTIDSIKAKSYFRLARSYISNGELRKSLEYAKIAKHELPKYNINVYYVIVNEGTLSSIYNKLQLFDKSDKIINGIFDIIDKNKNLSNVNQLLASAYITKSNYYKAQNKFKECISFEKVALSYANKIVPKTDYELKQKNQQILSVLYGLSDAYDQTEDYKSAEIYATRALPYTKVANHFFVTLGVKNILADCYECTGRPQKAIETLQEYVNNKEIDIAAQLNVNHILSNAYKQLNDQKNAEYFRNRKDSVMNSFNNEKICTSKEIIKLAEEEKAEEEKETKRVQLISGIIITLLLVTLLSLYIYYNRVRKAEHAKFLAQIKKYETAETEIYTEQAKTSLPAVDSEERKESLPIEKENEILELLSKFEKSEKFLNKDLTLPKLALTLKVNTNYLSHVINAYKGKNFNNYINELRINYISKMIYENPEYTTYKISYLAEISGFASHSSFATVFKSVTGISPSSYISMCRKKQ